MRYLKLSISLILSVIGLAVYFVTVPQIDEDELVHLTVQAGNEEILDDYSFNGYIYNYSSFSLTNEDILVPANLPYLEMLDAREEMEIMMLKETYPDFVNKLAYGTNTYSYLISADEEYLTSAHFEYQSNVFSEIYSKLQFRALNKETNKIEEDFVTRELGSNIFYASIVGINENYPVVDVLIDTRLSNHSNENFEVSELSLISYNFETKNMTETVLLKTPDYIEPVVYTAVHHNESIQAFRSFDSETSEEVSYLVDYDKDAIIKREAAGERLIVSDDSRLYSIVDTTLVEYDKTSQEKVSEVDLTMDFKENKNMDFAMNELFILDGKLFVLNNNEIEDDSERNQIRPTDLVVYAISTGEILVEGQFTYGGTEQVGAWAASIDQIKQSPTKD